MTRQPVLEQPAGESSAYYEVTGHVPLASRLSMQVRKRMFARFMEVMQPTEKMTVLDLGVTSDTHNSESNFFEQLYPWKHRLICAGTEGAHHLEVHFPGLRFVRVTPGEPLPFADGEFDIVFSNAVVEHTGNRAAQAAFIRELLRVGRRFFATTPNRWFPMEMHTCLPLLHYLPMSLHRRLLRILGHTWYAREENLNLLDKAALLRLFPTSCPVQVQRVRLFGMTSNLIAHGLTCQTARGDQEHD